jgi:hypothetical protein
MLHETPPFRELAPKVGDKLEISLTGDDVGVIRVAGAVVAGIVALTIAFAVVPPALSGRAPGPRRPNGSARGLAVLPVAIRGPISSALGRELDGYRITRLEARNGAQRLRASFSSAGATIQRAAGGHVRLALASVGRAGSAPRRLGAAVAPTARANRVDYRYRGLTESWANGPLGLEQSFVVDAPPAGRANRPLTISLAVTGNLRPRAGGASVVLGGALRYGALAASDAHGRRLPARLSVAGGRIRISVDDRGAAYPVAIDPIVQLAELTEAGGAAQDNFGTAVAADGDTVVVGAPNHASGAGRAYVFVRPAAGWSGGVVESADLTAGDGVPGDQFGASVAISGSTIMVGAPNHAVPFAAGAGAAYLFNEPSGGWSGALIQSAELTAAGGAASDGLGSSVALDGETAVAGAPSHVPGGAAYVFVKPPSGWSGDLTQAATLGFTGGTGGDAFGSAVAISGDTVVVGAPSQGTAQGAAYVFTKPAPGWSDASTQTAKLTATGGQAGDAFGTSVAVAGQTVAIGAPNHTVGTALAQGAVYVFAQPPAGWSGPLTQSATLAPAPAGVPGAGLGGSVSVTADGATVAAGAATETEGSNPDEGGAYLFAEPPTGWSGTVGQSLTLTPADGLAGDQFGSSVAISGATVVSGAPDRQVGFNAGLGITYVFGFPAPAISVTSPTDGAHYARDAHVTVAYTCAVSGATITACSGSVPNGATLDTHTLGAHSFTVTATSSEGVTATRTGTYTVAVPPALSPLHQTHRRWRRGSKLATIARTRTRTRTRTRARGRRPPVGTMLTFTLSEGSTVTFTFARKRTEPPKHKPPASPTLTLTARKGANTVTFDGRMSRRQRLSPGTYKVTAVASANGISSKRRSLTFTIVR